MKMWAVFDKDGEVLHRTITSGDERDAWGWFWASTKNLSDMNIGELKSIGYTCAPVVVMRESVYNEVARFHRDSLNRFKKMDDAIELKDEFNEFLKAGE